MARNAQITLKLLQEDHLFAFRESCLARNQRKIKSKIYIHKSNTVKHQKVRKNDRNVMHKTASVSKTDTYLLSNRSVSSRTVKKYFMD